MKIVINGFPRSGTTNFTDALRSAARPLRVGNHHERVIGKEWITNKNDALFFLPKYPQDVTVCYILRDPELAIASNVERWLKGFTGKMVSGMVIVDHHQKKDVGQLTDDIIRFIDDQVEIFKTYLISFMQNQDALEIIHYDQTRMDSANAIKNILSVSGAEVDRLADLTNAISLLRPTNPERTSSYFNILSYLKENNEFKEVKEIYLECLSVMNKKQNAYPFKLSMKVGE